MNKIDSDRSSDQAEKKLPRGAIASVLAEIREECTKRGTFPVTGTADLNTDVPQLLRLHGKMYVKYSK